MFKQMTDFLKIKSCNIYVVLGYYTQHALLRLFDKLNKSLDRKEKVGIFMTDLSKAFDCVPHDLLIA